MSAICALHGYKIGWMPQARIHDEQPKRFRDSVVQRRRWTAGSLQCMRRYAGKLIQKGTPASLDLAFLFLGNLMNYVGIVSVIATAVTFVGALRGGFDFAGRIPFIVAYAVGCWALQAVAATILLRMEGRLRRESLPTIMGFPIFMLSWTIINVYASLTPPPRWKVIRHTGDCGPTR